MKPETILIDEYMAKHGVRRFERGACGNYDAVQLFLLDRGYELRRIAAAFALKRIGQKGSGRRMNWAKVIAFADDLRVADGLEPINPSRRPKPIEWKKRVA